MEMKRFNYMLEIDILRNSSQKIGSPEGWFLRVWVSKKRHPDALLAKTTFLILPFEIYRRSGLLRQYFDKTWATLKP